MDEYQAKVLRVYQYLLAKDVFLKQKLIDRQKRVNRKSPSIEDVFALWYTLVKLEIWEEIAGELWKLLK